MLAAALRLPAQQVTLAGLRSLHHVGAFHGLRQDSAGDLYTLFDAQDGVRLLKFNAAGTTLLGEVLIGQGGDVGVALDLDDAGNVYVAGTSNSLGNIAGTQGTTFPNRAGTRTNSFIARFSPSLQEEWLTFCGAEPMAVTAITATSHAVLITGAIFAATLPVTAGGIQQSPAPNSGSNGFVESFATASGTLQYATYLTGANGDTTPAAIVADAGGNAYVAGTTTATGYPTTGALVPVFRAPDGSNVSGFVTELNAQGDGFLFSTFVPGGGLTSITLDSAGQGSLLLSGDVAPGLFPLTQMRSLMAPLLKYQTALRLAMDGSKVITSTLLAPATGSVIAPGGDGTAWVFASVQNTVPISLLPVLPLETFGNAFALRIGASGIVDRAARFGGVPTANSGFASLPATEGGIVIQADGSVALAGSVAPTVSSALLPTQTFELPFASAPNAALPSTVRDALPLATCEGSACRGSAGLLARLVPDANEPGLALSTDDLPNLTLRNLGTLAATNVQITAAGDTVASGCGAVLAPGAECRMSVTGNVPGAVTVRAGNTASFTTFLPATDHAATTLIVAPRELDFGIQTSASAAAKRTLTVTNLGATTQTFMSKNSTTLATTYTVAETASTCTPASDGVSKVLGPGGTCTITLGLTASALAANDGGINAHWQVGSSDVLLTAYAQAAAASLSAKVVDFGRQFAGGLRSPRHLYLSNSSDRAMTHAAVADTDSAFRVTDECPATVQARTVCRLVLGYEAANATSSDAMTLNVDGMVASILGETLPQPSATGSATNPNLRVSATAVSFANPVNVTQVSVETHAITVSNAGAVPFLLAVAATGDFTSQTSCDGTLAGGGSCTVVLSFTPSAPGTRGGLLSVTAGSSAPVFVGLSGTGTAIVSQTNGDLAFGEVPLNTPSVQWLKVSQSFLSLEATSTDAAFSVLLVEDTGYGHGEPSAGVFGTDVSGSCLNCYVGVQFLPTSTGAHAGVISLRSPGSGKPQQLRVSGDGVPLTGLILTPVKLDFGRVPVHSSSGTNLFQLTNGTSAAITANGASVAGDFVVTDEITGGAACTSGTVKPGASCFVPVRFVPAASGVQAGSLTVTTSAGLVTATLAGTGSDDPGVSFAPGELRFDNVPGAASQDQGITVTNTTSTLVAFGTPVVDDVHFTTTSACGTLAPGASCELTVHYIAGNALAGGTLTLPVTSAPAGVPSVALYAIALSGEYTLETAGLQVIPGEHTTVNFGAATTGAPALSRVLHVNNLMAKAMDVMVETPRQFAVTASTCAALASHGSCDLTVQYTPLTSGDATGTVLLQGRPADGSATQSGLAYLEGYGLGGSASLVLTGSISPAGLLSFGQVASGGLSRQTVTVTNPISSPAGTALTVRRIRSEFPYLSTSNCGDPLAPGQSCTVTVTYAPLYQAVAGGGQTATQTDAGTLMIESDGNNAPQIVDLVGSVTPAFVSVPVNSAPIAAFAVSQGSLTFVSAVVGTASEPQMVTLINTGSATVRVLGMLPSIGFSVSGTCGVLPAGATCDLMVTFVPQRIGTTLGALEIQTDASASLEFVSLLGTVVIPPDGPPAASVTLGPLSLDFGRVLLGRSTLNAAAFTNTGQIAVSLGAVTVTGGGFLLGTSATACPGAGGTLAAGAACTIPVVFAPGTVGTLRGTLSVGSSATSQPLTVALSGVSTQPQLVVSPTALNFGDVAVGSTGTLSLTLVNSSSTAVDGLGFTVPAGFAVHSTCGITTLNAGSSCAVGVTFTPSATGVSAGALTVRSSDAASPLAVPLDGNGIQITVLPSRLLLSPASLDFGNVVFGSSSTQVVTLFNTGQTGVSRLSMAATASFAVSSGCGATLGPGSSCAISVTYAPPGVGGTTGVLTVSSSDAGSPLTAALSGSGVTSDFGSFVLTVNGGGSGTATVVAGLPGVFPLSVTPLGSYTGTVALTCSADTPVAYAACSLVPPAVTLNGSPQGSAASISTVSATTLAGTPGRPLRSAPLLCLVVFLMVRRRHLAVLLLMLCGTTILSGGCGSGGDARIRYVAPGTYTFHVTAAATGGAPSAQSVALTLVVTPR